MVRAMVRGAVAVVAGAIAVASLTACEPTYTVKLTEVKLAIPCGGTTSVDAEWAIPGGWRPRASSGSSTASPGRTTR
ncbi:MAG: hypothetical protein JWO77_3133 [Ilumatobacteraceae bacterium]|nr:hypothetical protein [Ilumatobacteraceae bacterium]